MEGGFGKARVSVATEAKPQRMTIEEFEQFTGEPDKRYELVDGEIVEMSPPGGVHGETSLEAGAILRNYVRPKNLGVVYAAETGFIVRREPQLVRAPDVAFVARERLPEGRSPEGYVPLAPDFVVEVVSPNDSAKDVQARIDTWLKAGVKNLWAVYPATRVVMIHRGLDRIDRKSGDEELDAEPAVPGFRCKVSDLFPSP